MVFSTNRRPLYALGSDGARQFFFVLSGTTTFEVAGERQVLRPFEGAEVPPKFPHQMLNESEHEAEIIVVSQPASHGERILAESIETANT